MRRIVLSLAAVIALSACGGGGSVLSFDTNTRPDRVIVTTVGPSNVPRVLPGASIPLSATAVRGSNNGLVNVNQFTWSAQLITSGVYQVNELGQTKPCGVVNATVGGVATPLVADFSIYLTIDPTNQANVIFTPPPTIPTPAGATAVALPTGNAPYCVVVSATPKGGNSQNSGSLIVAVVNPLAPEL
jgi:hypothetical protein